MQPGAAEIKHLWLVCADKECQGWDTWQGGEGDVTVGTFVFFSSCHLRCQIPDLIARENAEVLNSLHFQPPRNILESTPGVPGASVVWRFLLGCVFEYYLP